MEISARAAIYRDDQGIKVILGMLKLTGGDLMFCSFENGALAGDIFEFGTNRYLCTDSTTDESPNFPIVYHFFLATL